MSIQCFLSTDVKHLLVELYNEAKIVSLESNFDKIPHNFIGEESFEYFCETAQSMLKDGTLQSTLDFEIAIKSLLPLFLQVSSVSYSNEEMERMVKVIFSWLDGVSIQTISEWFEKTKIDQSCSCILHLLQMTAALERTLGNVYLLEGPKCPFLLRDLIQSNELKKIFGETIMKVLCVLLGGPFSLNLRNLVWHGFVNADEIPSVYISVIRFMLFHLATFCFNQSLQPATSLRPLIVKHSEISLVQEKFGSLYVVKQNIGQVKFLLEQSSFIVPIRKPFFQFALQLFECNRFGDCVMIVLPQIEHILRCRYALCNECPERMMTAESTQFYTTLDHIVCQRMSDGRLSKMEEEVGEFVLMMLMDLFTYHEGLRLRDHLSHGEMSSHDVTEALASAVLTLSVLVSQERPGGTNFGSEVSEVKGSINEVNQAAHERSTCDSSRSTFFLTLIEFSRNYESLFHPLCSAKRDLKHCLNSMPPLPTVIGLYNRVYGEDFRQTNHEDELASGMIKIGLQYYSFGDCGDSHQVHDDVRDDVDSTINRLFEKRVKTLYRHESYGVTIKQISICMRKISTNLSVHLQQRSLQCKKKMLRSRQRRNFQRFLLSFPTYDAALKSLTLILLLIIHESREPHNVFTRKLKLILQICENSVTFTSSDVNKWDNFVEQITNLRKLLVF